MALTRWRHWLPAICWMVVIFIGSTGVGAPRTTSRFLGPLLRWLFPEISQENEEAIIFVIRKCAHAVEYAVLSLLLWYGRRQSQERKPAQWFWADAWFAILWSGLYAASDEFHQYVGSRLGSARQGSIWDVLLDTAGAAAAMVVLRMGGRLFRRWD